MIIDEDESNVEGGPKIKGGMLIDWDLCKVVDPQDKGSSARQYMRTVSKYVVAYLLSVDVSSTREHGSSWRRTLFSLPLSLILSCTTSSLRSGF